MTQYTTESKNDGFLLGLVLGLSGLICFIIGCFAAIMSGIPVLGVITGYFSGQMIAYGGIIVWMGNND